MPPGGGTALKAPLERSSGENDWRMLREERTAQVPPLATSPAPRSLLSNAQGHWPVNISSVNWLVPSVRITL